MTATNPLAFMNSHMQSIRAHEQPRRTEDIFCAQCGCRLDPYNLEPDLNGKGEPVCRPHKPKDEDDDLISMHDEKAIARLNTELNAMMKQAKPRDAYRLFTGQKKAIRNRERILNVLSQPLRGPLTAPEIVFGQPPDLTATMALQHLRRLEEVGLVRCLGQSKKRSNNGTQPYEWAIEKDAMDRYRQMKLDYEERKG